MAKADEIRKMRDKVKQNIELLGRYNIRYMREDVKADIIFKHLEIKELNKCTDVDKMSTFNKWLAQETILAYQKNWAYS